MEPTRQWIEESVAMVPEAGCWIFMGSVCPMYGYGRVRVQRRYIRAHRAAYRLFVSPIPAGKMVLHHCDVRCCVNPAHLYLGDQHDNMKDCATRGRIARMKLSAEDVKAIRNRHGNGEQVRALAGEFAISTDAIYDLLNRRTWRHAV